MKTKFLQLIGLNIPQCSFSDLDMDVRLHFIFEYILSIFFFIIDIIFLVTSHMFEGFMFGLIMALMYAVYVTYAQYMIRGGTAAVIVGNCTSIDKETKTFFSKTRPMISKSEMSVRADNGLLYTVPVAYLSKFAVGNKVKIYTAPNNVSQINADTVKVLSPIFISILKN